MRYTSSLPDRSAFALLALALAPVTNTAFAQETSALAELINSYRAVSRACAAKRAPAASPLAPNPVLASTPLPASNRLLDALKSRGYPAAGAQVITVSGPTSAGTVMKFIEERYCSPLMSPQYSEIGVRRDADRWQIVLARPLLSANLGDWRQSAEEILRLTNAARAKPRACGDRRFGAAPPLAWNDKLANAALAHSRDMASRNYFEHAGSDGSRPADRVTREGYVWQNTGENIAAGQGSAGQAMAGWLTSPVHCANVMSSEFAEMGAAFALNPGSDATIYWTQVFGTAR